jgi:hypothetical protein
MFAGVLVSLPGPPWDIDDNRMGIIVQTSAKNKRSSFAKAGEGQIEVSRDLGFAIFAPDLFDCIALGVGALPDQQLLTAALDSFLTAQSKIRLQRAVLQRIDNIVGDPAGHEGRMLCRSHPERDRPTTGRCRADEDWVGHQPR